MSFEFREEEKVGWGEVGAVGGMIHDPDPALSQGGDRLVCNMRASIVMQEPHPPVSIITEVPEMRSSLPHSCAQLGQDLAIQFLVDGAMPEIDQEQ